jgi:septum formation protein
MYNFVLASASPRRKDLLNLAEIKFEVLVSDADELFPETMPKEEVPVFIAKQKALAVSEKLKTNNKYATDICIIAADTIVVIGNELLGKPIDRQDAINSLSKLSGKTHRVITGISLLYNDQLEVFSETTFVEFHHLSKEQIEYYVDQYKPYDKAGAYAIQEWIGVIGIKSIQGDFYNVMGLPVSKLIQKLKQLTLLD